MLDCTQDSLLAPWILESTPLLSCAVGDKRSTTSIQSHSKWKPAVNSGMKSLGNTVVNGTCTAGGKLGVDEDDDDLFSTNRSSYSSTFCRVGGARPTMISAKYRQKEERRKVLKISISKLKKIEDPESSLRRSVLINNTMKRLQREAREEKLHKQQAINSGFNRCFAADFFKDDENTIDQVTSVQSSRSTEQLVDITNLPEITNSTKTSPMTSALMSKPTSMTTTSTTTVVTSICLEDCLGCDETMPDVVDSSSMLCSSVTSNEDSPANRGAGGRKRSFDDVDDSDVQDVLSQFYMPPTPRMLTSIDDDEDEDVNVVDLDTPCEKRPRLECEHEQSAADRLKNMTRQQTSLTCVESIEQRLTMSDNIEQRLTMSDNIEQRLTMSDNIEQRLTMSNNIEQRLTMSASDVSERCSSSSGGGASTSSSSSSSSFSCGHSSMFNELQSVVYHSLIASLET